MRHRRGGATEHGPGRDTVPTDDEPTPPPTTVAADRQNMPVKLSTTGSVRQGLGARTVSGKPGPPAVDGSAALIRGLRPEGPPDMAREGPRCLVGATATDRLPVATGLASARAVVTGHG